MEEKELGILRVAETNTNWKDGKQKEAQLEIKARFGQGKIIASLSKLRNEGYLLGGTATITRVRVTSLIVQRGKDGMGRFTWIQLNGKITK